jgi:inorganic pyrophosphatase
MNAAQLHTISPLFNEELGIINAVIETPAGSQNKYDYDQVSGLFMLDRPIHSALRYPCDYGFIPNTLAKDGDPVDVVLMINQPTYPGCLVRARVVGVMIMEDEAGRDEKILSVSDRDPRLSHIMDIKDVPPNYLKELEHFFIHIKDLEQDKWAKVEGFDDKAKGISVVREGIRNGRTE